MRRLLPLLLCCLLLTGCARDPIAPLASEYPAEVPAPAAAALPANDKQAVLWFRFGGEPLLAPETRTISVNAAENSVLPLLRALVQGPGAASTELEGLFPAGTQVISATQADRVMFVTLSRHIMNGYADEPADWRSQPDWAEEVPLRRVLAMQSIAATLTENCAVDTVVILVDQSATDSLRLRRSYYTLDGDTALADPLTRDEALLLTPARTAEIILQCWTESDWTRLYRYVAQVDPATGRERPGESAFVAAMSESSHLLYAAAQGGSVHQDSAVFTAEGAFLVDGTEKPFTGLVLRLTREKSLWRIGYSQLIRGEAAP